MALGHLGFAVPCGYAHDLAPRALEPEFLRGGNWSNGQLPSLVFFRGGTYTKKSGRLGGLGRRRTLRGRALDCTGPRWSPAHSPGCQLKACIICVLTSQA